MLLLYGLAEKMGRTVAELCGVLTPNELQHWRALWKIRRDEASKG